MLFWLIPLIILISLILFAADYFYRLAIVRNTSAKKKKKSTAKSNKPGELDQYRPLMEQCEAWLKAQDMETVHILSHDGLKLAGHFLNIGSKKTIILFHGYRSRPFRDFSCVGEYYKGLGFNQLFVDQRAHEQSEGEHITFGVKERLDCVRWAEYIDRRIGGEIILDGLSMGATTVLMAAGEKLPESVKGVIADCGFTSPEEIMLKVMEKDLKIRCRPLFHLVALLVKLRAGFSVSEYSTIEAMKKNRLPILFIHGTGDRFVPCEMTKSAYDACVSEKTLVLVEEAGHGTSYLKDPDACKAALNDFLKKHTREG